MHIPAASVLQSHLDEVAVQLQSLPAAHLHSPAEPLQSQIILVLSQSHFSAAAPLQASARRAAPFLLCSMKGGRAP